MKTLCALAASSLLLLSSCGMVTIMSDNYDRNARLAVVSVNLDGLEAGDAGAAPPEHIPPITAKLLDQAEKLLGQKFRVVSAASLADRYQQLSFGARAAGTYTPIVAGKEMVNFTPARDQVVAGKLSADAVDKLVDGLGVDVVAVVYTKWSTSLEKTDLSVVKQNPGRGAEVTVMKLMPVVKTSLRVYMRGGEVVFEGSEQVVAQKYVESADTAVSVAASSSVRDAMVGAYFDGLRELVKQVH